MAPPLIDPAAVREHVRRATGFDPSDVELRELVERVRDQEAAAEFLRELRLEEAPALSFEESP